MNSTSELLHSSSRLNDAVFRQIGEDIVRGVLPAGEPLHDAAIAARFGVSRTPVREALLRLERVGLIVILASRRTVVSTIDPTTLEDSRRWVGHLATIAFREALPRMSDSDRGVVSALALAVVEAGSDAHLAATAQFALLESIADRSGSEILRGEVREWEFTIRRALREIGRADSARAALHTQYRDLADAIRSDERDGAVQILGGIFGIVGLSAV